MSQPASDECFAGGLSATAVKKSAPSCQRVALERASQSSQALTCESAWDLPESRSRVPLFRAFQNVSRDAIDLEGKGSAMFQAASRSCL